MSGHWLATAIYDFPRTKYPFTLEFLHPDTHVVVWSVTVEAPPEGENMVLRVPPLSAQLGHRVVARVTFADGTTEGPTDEARPQ